MSRSWVALSLLLIAMGLSACSHGSRPSPTSSRVVDRIHGLAFTLPAGWHRASTNLTPHLVDPREELSAATYALHYRRGNCAQVPAALGAIPPTGAFVTMQERGAGSGAGFPSRPVHFGPGLGGPADFRGCFRRPIYRDSWFTFADHGRHFHVEVAFGPRTSRATQQQAWALLDSLRIDPRVRPNWRGSP